MYPVVIPKSVGSVAEGKTIVGKPVRMTELSENFKNNT